MRTLTRLVLHSYGYTVLEARDGQEGLRENQVPRSGQFESGAAFIHKPFSPPDAGP